MLHKFKYFIHNFILSHQFKYLISDDLDNKKNSSEKHISFYK